MTLSNSIRSCLEPCLGFLEAVSWGQCLQWLLAAWGTALLLLLILRNVLLRVMQIDCMLVVMTIPLFWHKQRKGFLLSRSNSRMYPQQPVRPSRLLFQFVLTPRSFSQHRAGSGKKHFLSNEAFRAGGTQSFAPRKSYERRLIILVYQLF